MAERLKQIWTGFAGATTRRLTGEGVDNIAAPIRHAETTSAFIAPDAEAIAPAAAAFEALRHRLSASEARAARKAQRRAGGKRSAMEDAPPAPLTAEASPDGAPDVARDLIRGLKATEARTHLAGADYHGHLAANPDLAKRIEQGKWMSGKPSRADYSPAVTEAAPKRRRILGIF